MTMSTDDFLAHHGVKGMKWGIRKETYRAVRNGPRASMDLVTPKGQTVTVVETRKGRIASALSAISPDYRKDVDKYKSFDISVGGKHVGEASFHDKGSGELNMVWLGVRPQYRGQGYGSSVFGAGVAYAQKQGYSKITLEVPGNAPDAHHIYSKLGFKDAGKVGDSEDDDYWGGLTNMVYDVPKRSKNVR